MTNDVTQQGWYPDPMRGSGERWWDGATWTDRTRDAVLPVPRADERASGPSHQPTAARRALPPEDGWDDEDDADDDTPIRLGARSASSPLHWQSPPVMGTPSEPTTVQHEPAPAPAPANAASPYLPATPDTGNLPRVREEAAPTMTPAQAAPVVDEPATEQTSQLPAQRSEVEPARAERALETPSRAWLWWLLVPAALLLLVALLLGIQLTVPGGLPSLIDRILH